MAQRERERAQHAHAVDQVEHAADAGGDRRRGRPLEGEDLDPLLRADRPERRSVQERPAAALGRPLLARPEVVDVAEDDVLHPRTLGEGEGEGEERDPALRVHRAVHGVDDHVAGAAGAERERAELLRYEHEVLAEVAQARDHRLLGRSVDRGGVVAALAEP